MIVDVTNFALEFALLSRLTPRHRSCMPTTAQRSAMTGVPQPYRPGAHATLTFQRTAYILPPILN